VHKSGASAETAATVSTRQDRDCAVEVELRGLNP
jgi:hypothetical protein